MNLEKIITYLLIIISVFFFFLPIYLVITFSLKSPRSILYKEYIFIPTLDNYSQIFRDLRAHIYFLNSLIISSLTTIIVLPLSILSAYALARFKFKGSESLSSWMLSLLVFPSIIPSIAFWLLFKYIGLMDTHIGVSLTHLTFALPLSIWLLRGFFSAIPIEYEEAAIMDGYGTLSIIRKIMIPLARPGIIVTACLCFLFSWTDLTFALILAPNVAKTLPVVSLTYLGIRGALYWGRISALTALSFLPVALLTIIFRLDEYIVKGFLAQL